MEVQDRALLAPRGLSGRLAAVWAWRWAALALATVVTVAALVVDAQPVRSPWWTYADADASYTASALNLVLGRDVPFVDHPGLPITEAVAAAFAAEALVAEGSFSDRARLAFVDRTLLDLDSARGTFRGFAVAFYLAGALLAFLLAARLFGHWTWGLASGLLWFAAPGLVPMSIQLRPDVLLAALTLLFAFAVARAVERRSAPWFAAAAALVGFATMVKLHALALLPALALAAVWRRAPEEEVVALPRWAVRWARRRSVVAGIVVAAWLALALLLNVVRLPWHVNGEQLLAFALLASAVAVAVAAAEAAARLRTPRAVRRVASRFHALVVGAFAAGLLLPVTIDVPEGLRTLVYISNNVSGRGVQSGVDSFSTPFSALESIVGTRVLIVFWIALLAAVVGLVRRDPRPVVWSAAAASMGAMAFARPPNVHYFAPSFVLAAFALLWLLQREPRARASVLVWPVVLLVFWPAWNTRKAPAAEQERLVALVEPAKRYVDQRLAPGEVALVPSYWPFADSRFFELVQIYVDHTPNYPYRYLPAIAAVRPFAALRGLRPRFFVGPQATELQGPQRLQLGDLGEYTIAKAPGGELVAEIVQGPGLTEPW